MQTTINAPRDVTPIAGWLAVLLPLTTATGAAAIDIVGVVIGALFLAHSWMTRDFRWLKEPPVVLLLAVWVFTAVRTAIAGPSLLQYGDAVAWIRFPLLAAALGYWVLRSAQWRDRLLISTAVTCGFLAADGLLQYIVGRDVLGNPMEMGRLTASIGKPRVGVGIAWMFLPAVFGLLQWRHFRAAGALALGGMVTIALSGDRMALLFALAGLALCVALMPALWREAWKALIVMAALLAVVLFTRPEVYQRQITSTVSSVRNIDNTHYGVIWNRAFVMARSNLLSGVGINRYRQACPDPHYGAVAQSGPNQFACGDHPHNLYLEWLVEGGLVGLAGFIGAFVLIGRQLCRALPVLRTDMVFMALLVTLTLRLLPLSTATSITRSWYSMPLWLVVGWAVAMARDARNTQKIPEPVRAPVS